MKVLHVIERLGRGGAARSMLAQAKYTARADGVEHVVLSLRPPDPAGLGLARDAGTAVVHGGADEAREAVGRADVTQLHFWNTPELYAWLRAGLPATRLLLTLHVAGEHPAQVATRAVLDLADLVLVATPYSLDLPVVRDTPTEKVALILDTTDLERLGRVRPRLHAHFTVGYVGTVSLVKMHPRFVEMSAAACLPQARFRVCGDGDALGPLARRAANIGGTSRFEWLGYVDDVAPVLASLDVFGYPLRADSYAAGELVLQEAMHAGVPPVVLEHGAAARLIVHGETGLVARGEGEYTAALERLFREPATRARLGANARAHARERFGGERAARELRAVYERAMTLPRRERRWRTRRLSAHEGADAFIESLGETAGEFRTSLLAEGDGAAREAERAIAAASPVVTDAAAGGLLHYRRVYPDDPYLRLWSGLVLMTQGRPALAAAELHRARALGLATPRVDEYLAGARTRAR